MRRTVFRYAKLFVRYQTARCLRYPSGARLYVDALRFRSRLNMLVNLFPSNTSLLGSGKPNCDTRVSVYG